MAREYSIEHDPYCECAVCGGTMRTSRSRRQGGFRVCKKCKDTGPYAQPPHHGFTTIRWNVDEYGICTQIEEFGYVPQKTNSEYGVLTEIDNIKIGPERRLSSISGEYGTMTWLVDFKLPYIRT
jgi:hypothetical protein